MREPDLATAEKRARRCVRNRCAYPGLAAVYVKTLMAEYDRRGTDLADHQHCSCEDQERTYAEMARYVDELGVEQEQLRTELAEFQSPWKRCPKWCDGPECDCPPRAGGSCLECAEAHFAAHLAEVPRPYPQPNPQIDTLGES